MDNIKQQIKEWESVLKANKAEIKAIETQNKAIEAILKNLRALQGKDEVVVETPEGNTADGFAFEETR